MSAYHNLTAVMPALNEEDSIPHVIQSLQQSGITSIIVGDNGSTDNTKAIAEESGALVVPAPIRGYGAACLAALTVVPDHADAVLFCDADGADEFERIPELCDPVLTGSCDLIIGSRTLGGIDKGAQSVPQMIGNLVASFMMRTLYDVSMTDLGPFRCISIRALRALAMQDQNFGWTAEMQLKAYRRGLRVREIPVRAKNRIAGESKIGGKLIPGIKAGWIIISTILYYQRIHLARWKQ